MGDPGKVKRERRGLKAFSAMILALLYKERVMEYSRVAEVIYSMTNTGDADDKNIKRRIYDALNVMCAVGLVRKEKRKIYLNAKREGCFCPEGNRVQDANSDLLLSIRNRVAEKKQTFEDTIARKDLLLRLIERNRASRGCCEEKDHLHFPFLILCTGKKSPIDCETNEKRTYFRFKFKAEYEIYEDVHILKKIFEGRGSAKGGNDENTPNVKSKEKGEDSPLYSFAEEEDWMNIYNFLS
jgi:transcription factor Dp-1